MLYRTPNIVIGEFEWHIAVMFKNGRVRRDTRWRPVSEKPEAWHGVATFGGRMPAPSLFKEKFTPFQRHISQAERSVIENRRIARDLQRKRADRFAERAAA